ncbi:protein CURVATURE THYLAKOID 1A, chloroplastic [Rutidosis leptorrhynchoides]|uniref:protein CURVATURE THYLAKOID 1A, chloroplastic n=1 Tax=Rutidosis leptorrhynchoides TaxID=125765 RepID=UPI003A99E098
MPELCTLNPNLLSYPTSSYRTNSQFKFTLPLKPSSFPHQNSGLSCYRYVSVKAKASDEASTGANQYVKNEPDVVNHSPLESKTDDEISNGANRYVDEESDGVVTEDEAQTVENNGFGGFSLFKNEDDTAINDEFPQFDFLNKLKVEVDLEDSFSIALLGVGGIAALWLTVSVVGAIDRIPLFPKLLEVVGLGYTIWFSTRYLLFKKNRDELASKVEGIKQQVLGPKD